ncbi:MAG: MoxR family ATPase [Verrucomicrobiae bacterium]|nr:MoxR family ATPase [Verrucomicrobiae bacterium]
MSENTAQVEAQAAEFKTQFTALRDEMHKLIVGQTEIIDGVLLALFGQGHVLLEGVPGLGKTMLVRTLAEAVHLDFSRIQFTPDMMPADIIGTKIIVEDREKKRFEFQPGPLFSHIVLADEINRATPKTQSALLEAMQEKHVTVGGERYELDEPFLVMATQNPLEMEGTYPLPEAQLDRFFFKLLVQYPAREEMSAILDRTTESETPVIQPVLDRDQILAMRRTLRAVPIAAEVQDYAIHLVMATHPESAEASPLAKSFVRYGSSPRGAQVLILAGKALALLDERFHVSKDDIRQAALAALRHRIILNFEGEAEGITPDQIVTEILGGVPEPIQS